MDKETKERVERPYVFQEFPKMKHHPDGRTATVNSSHEESALGEDWCNTPQQALDERAKRDRAAELRVAERLAAEAADADDTDGDDADGEKRKPKGKGK